MLYYLCRAFTGTGLNKRGMSVKYPRFIVATQASNPGMVLVLQHWSQLVVTVMLRDGTRYLKALP